MLDATNATVDSLFNKKTSSIILNSAKITTASVNITVLDLTGL